MRKLTSTAFALSLVAMAACNDRMTTQPSSSISPDGARAATDASGALDIATADHDDDFSRGNGGAGGVFTSSNAVGRNTVVAFTRRADGRLVKHGEFASGGAGIGGAVDPLASQGALVLDEDRRRLYVVNAGSNSISTFVVSDDADLRLVATASSRGVKPVSIATTDHRLFVLNAGDNSVAGFSVGDHGIPSAIAGSQITLGAASDGPGAIDASHDGKYLFVTQRAANAIDIIAVGERGALRFVTRRQSSGATPFGFAVTNRDQLIVSEAGGAAPNGAVSSYSLSRDGSLKLISGSLSTLQTATCWLVLSDNGRFAYAANAGSGSITGYAVGQDGSLHALSADGRTGVTTAANSTPLDLGISRNGRFLYVLQTGTGTIGAFAIGNDGHLTTLADTPGLAAAAGFQGLAAF